MIFLYNDIIKLSVFCFQNLEFLSLSRLQVSQKLLLDLCSTMTHMIQLDLTYVDCVDDEVLRTIAVSMPQLQQLDLGDCRASLSALECLLPSEDLGRRGCPELRVLNICELDNVTVEFLKKIIFCLPKLRFLRHKLMVAVLAELTDEELGMKFGRCLLILRVDMLRSGLLQNAPIFALDCNITVVSIRITLNSSKSVMNLLMPFQKLNCILIYDMVNSREGFMSVLELKGHRLNTLCLHNIDETVTPYDIIRTCPNIEELALSYVRSEAKSDSEADQESQRDRHEVWCFLFHLKKISLVNVSRELCSSETLISYLMCPQLEEINFDSVQVMSNDVMFIVMSFSRTALSRVKSFTLTRCPAITAAPFVKWLNIENIVLEDLHIIDCDMDDKDVLQAAVEKYPRPLNVTCD